MDRNGTQRVLIEFQVPSGERDALAMASQVLPAGVSLDQDFAPVAMGQPASADAAATPGATPATRTVVMRGTVTPEALEALQADPNVSVWNDGPIAAFERGTFSPPDLSLTAETGGSPCTPFDCDASNTAEGDLAAMARALKADKLWADGYTGKDIVIGICDTGVRASHIPAFIGGWSPPGGTPPGDDSAQGHGSMCATDALGACPDAKILDIGILKSQSGLGSLLSDALAAYDWALDRYRNEGTPQILSNSWGIYQQNWIPDYACDLNHPFTRKVVEVIDAGILVAFAAGNCGEVCPSSRCGGDNGPGKSIWGANGHPRVITVGAVNVHDAWVGYTSQGPSCMSERKPDVCGISHFQGYTALDNGTSAACPTIAGVLGLLKEAKPNLTQDEAMSALTSTARNVCSPGWDSHSGAGVVDAYAASTALAKTAVKA